MIQPKVRKNKKTCFNAHFYCSQSKITRLNEMRSLKSLASLKCEQPVQVPRWASNFAAGFKTKLKDFSGELSKNYV